MGINLLREGLDLPEVSLVAIMDADKEGFLRSESALRRLGARRDMEQGKVIMYANNMTRSMNAAISETNRRREIQKEYNTKHGITPTSVSSEVGEGLRAIIPQKEDKSKKLDLKENPSRRMGKPCS